MKTTVQRCRVAAGRRIAAGLGLSAALTLAGAAAAQDVVRTKPTVITPPSPAAAVTPGRHGAALSDVPLLLTAVRAPTCGDIPLSAPVACVTTSLASMNTVAQAYIDHYKDLGWIAADGDDNRIVMIRRRDGGGCDGMQMIAFYDTTKPDGPDVPGYLGFASIAGDVCAAPPATDGAAPSSATPQSASEQPASPRTTTPQ